MNSPRLSFANRLTLSYVLLVAVTLVVMAALLERRLKRDFIAQLENSLTAQAQLIGDLAQSPDTWQPLATDLGQRMKYRVTLIDARGQVRGDSERTAAEVQAMENHGTRPEIRAALQSGMGESLRHSATLHADMLYVAVPMPKSRGVVRVALPLTQLKKRLAGVRKDLVRTAVLSLFIALVMAYFAGRRINQPLEDLLQRIGPLDKGASHPIDADEFGRLAGTISGMADRINAQVKQLQADRGQLSAILAALVEAVVALDHQGRVLLLNAAAEKLFDVRSQDMEGKPFLEALRQGPLVTLFGEALRTQLPLQREITLHSPSERILSVQTRAVEYGEGRTGLLAALHDISELRRLATLRQEFVANVSHELKTPLTSIKGYVETLLDGAMDDKKHNRDFLETIQQHVNNLTQLIDDLLDLSRIEARRMEYRMGSVDVVEVVGRIVKALEPTAKGKRVMIKNALGNELPKVKADRDKLAQIFVNLIDNAIKFNREEGRVEIGASVKGALLEFSVSDTGQGIAPEDLPRVFERFFRADRAHSHEIKGTGLGLAIVKHLVEAQGGTVTAESTPGQGSTFRFTLPLA